MLLLVTVMDFEVPHSHLHDLSIHEPKEDNVVCHHTHLPEKLRDN